MGADVACGAVNVCNGEKSHSLLAIEDGRSMPVERLFGCFTKHGVGD